MPSKSQIFFEWKRIFFTHKKKILLLYKSLEYDECIKLRKCFYILKSKSLKFSKNSKKILLNEQKQKNQTMKSKVFMILRIFKVRKTTYYENSYKALKLFHYNLKKKAFDSINKFVELNEKKYLISRTIISGQIHFILKKIFQALKTKYEKKIHIRGLRYKFYYVKLLQSSFFILNEKMNKRKKLIEKINKKIMKKIFDHLTNLLSKKKKLMKKILGIQLFKKKKIFSKIRNYSQNIALSNHQRKLAEIAFKEKILNVFFSYVKKSCKLNKKNTK